MTNLKGAVWRRTVAALLLGAFVPLASACFGSFQLTRKVYRLNKSVSLEKWVRWLVFLAANVVPVYAFSVLFDAIFANSVEFWTGSNPTMGAIEPQTVVGPNGQLATLLPVAGGAHLTLVEGSGAVHRMTLLREAPGVVAAYDADGRLVSRMTGFGSVSPRIEVADRPPRRAMP
jgi:hypothetical protein